jgi:hypothetical protein
MGCNKASYITVDFYSVGIDGEEDTEMWIVNGKAVKPMSGVKLKIGSTVTFYHPNATSYCVNYYDEETQEFWYEDINRNGICSIEVTEKMVYIDAVIDGGGGGGGDDSQTINAWCTNCKTYQDFEFIYNDGTYNVYQCPNCNVTIIQEHLNGTCSSCGNTVTDDGYCTADLCPNYRPLCPNCNSLLVTDEHGTLICSNGDCGYSEAL